MYPLKMFGIVIRSSMLSSIGFGLLSIIGTLAGYQYSKIWSLNNVTTYSFDLLLLYTTNYIDFILYCTLFYK